MNRSLQHISEKKIQTIHGRIWEMNATFHSFKLWEEIFYGTNQWGIWELLKMLIWTVIMGSRERGTCRKQ